MARTRLTGIIGEVWRHSYQHLFIPLTVGFAFEAGVEYYVERVNRELIEHEWFLPIRLGVVFLSIIGAYFVNAFLILRDEGRYAIDPDGISLINSHLETAKSYFAVSVIDMREWFSPPSLSYLRLLEKYKEKVQFERVLFFNKRDMRYVSDYFVGRNAAKLFADYHADNDIRLLYFNPKAKDEPIKKLHKDEQKIFNKWSFRKTLSKVTRIHHNSPLDFALIESKTGEIAVLLINKESEVEEVDGDKIGPYINLVKSIREVAYKKDADGNLTDEIRRGHDFRVKTGTTSEVGTRSKPVDELKPASRTEGIGEGTDLVFEIDDEYPTKV